MLKRCTFGVVLLVGVLGVALWTPAVQAAERTCRGTLGAVTVGDVRVPAGASCTLNGTRVQGSVTVAANATLIAHTVVVTNNLHADGAKAVTVDQGSSVRGNVQVVKGGSASILDSRVNGSIRFDENAGAVDAQRNVVGNNLTADDNTGGVVIADNTITGNLHCKDNDPAPVGGNNVVGGNADDQCQGL